MKKENTVLLKIMALGMSLIMVSLILFTLPLSVTVITANGPSTIQNSQPTPHISLLIRSTPAPVTTTVTPFTPTPAQTPSSPLISPAPAPTVTPVATVTPFTPTPAQTPSSPSPTPFPTIRESSTITGNIHVTSDPPGIDVFLDNDYMGMTPVRILNLYTGTHKIELVKGDYAVFSSVDVKPDETSEVHGVFKLDETNAAMMVTLTLKSNLTGNIYVTSDPPRVAVYLDDDYRGITPTNILNTSTGIHEIKLVKEGYEIQYAVIYVKPNETLEFQGVLPPDSSGPLGWMRYDISILSFLSILTALFAVIMSILFIRGKRYKSKSRGKEEKLVDFNELFELKYKIDDFKTEYYLMEDHINNIEFELKRIAEFIDMQPRENPYVAGGVVDDPKLWIGNKNLINRVLASIRRNHFFIRGERRSGKTTLLLRISRALEMKTDPEVRFIPVYVSLQGIPPKMFFERLYKAIVNKENMNDIEEPEKIVDVEDFINAMSYIIESLNNSSSTKSVIVLLLDEFDLFNFYPIDLRESFRTVFMGPPEFSEHIRLIATGTEIEGWTRSSPMNYLIEIEIEPLTAEEAREMILRPAKGVASFDDAAVNKIIEGAHGRPVAIQKICEKLINTAIQKRVYRIQEEDVEELINSLEFKEGSK